MPDSQYYSSTLDCDADGFTFCSASDSMETNDDLPGTGRILGKIYDFTGRLLENQLGDIAERLGYGPRAAAV
ncbi:hypothetical protein EW145_g3662 [Phellinidium pouzarii]|uniref:Uncharacterized protein n=1 Tax=Phellinidium pouzarii TaxID=167371 RepID=A0A4S4L7U2_9AGAM|nr:hypothetical protein EW145_g3662 [Phellinidium pouzarii]